MAWNYTNTKAADTVSQQTCCRVSVFVGGIAVIVTVQVLVRN